MERIGIPNRSTSLALKIYSRAKINRSWYTRTPLWGIDWAKWLTVWITASTKSKITPSATPSLSIFPQSPHPISKDTIWLMMIMKKALTTNWPKARIWGKDYIGKKGRWLEERQARIQKVVLPTIWASSWDKYKNQRRRKSSKASEPTPTKTGPDN